MVVVVGGRSANKPKKVQHMIGWEIVFTVLELISDKWGDVYQSFSPRGLICSEKSGNWEGQGFARRSDIV